LTELIANSSVGVPRTAGSSLTREQKRNLALASLGSLLEFYEFMVFGFFTVVIGKLFFPPDLPNAVKVFEAFALYSLGFLLRPVSGALVGHFGDKFGRKKLFMITVVLMAVPTALIGLLPTYAAIGIAAPLLLLLLRIVQGLAVAGEFAGASVFMTEHVPGSRLGLASGVILGASYIGFFLGAGTGAFMANVLTPRAIEAWGWRIPFLIGGLFGLLSVHLRRKLDETPLFLEIRQMKNDASVFPLRDVVRRYWASALFDVGLGVYLGTMIIILYFYMPSLLQVQYGFDRTTTFDANAAALLLLALLCPLWGKIADRLGYASVLGFGAAALIVDLVLFFGHLDEISRDPRWLVCWSLSFSVFMSTAAVIPALCALVFPTQVRFSGFGFAYNTGSLIAAFAPTVISGIVLNCGKSSVVYYGVATGLIGVALAIGSTRLRTYPRPG
jgi:MFS family permease